MRSVFLMECAATLQSTLGAELARLLGVPFISLDTIYWMPNWEERPDDEFKEKATQALTAAEGGWVVDGNYSRILGDVVDPTATDIVCKPVVSAGTRFSARL